MDDSPELKRRFKIIRDHAESVIYIIDTMYDGKDTDDEKITSLVATIETMLDYARR